MNQFCGSQCQAGGGDDGANVPLDDFCFGFCDGGGGFGFAGAYTVVEVVGAYQSFLGLGNAVYDGFGVVLGDAGLA